MSDERASELIRQHERMVQRPNWDNLFQEVAERVWPHMADFNVKRAPGEKRTEKIFDSTAPMALDRGTAAVHSLTMPDNQYWHGLTIAGDPELSEFQPVKAWLEDIRNRLFALRRDPRASFSPQVQECTKSLLGFGTEGMYIEDVVGSHARYKSMPLSKTFIAENKDGAVDLFHRNIDYTARQAAQAWGLEKLPAAVKNAYEKKDEQSRFPFFHCVKPNEERETRRRDYRGMAFSSYYVSMEGRSIVGEGGFRRFPAAFSRYSTNADEVYGRGPAIVLLPDIKMLNEMEKTTLRAGHMAIDPPLLLYEDGSLQSFQMRPRALNFGGVDAQGRQLVQPLQTGTNLPWAFDMLEARRKLINEGFWITLFQILVENPSITATEALLRAQEKGQLLAPVMGRRQSEFSGAVIRREIDILSEAGLLPPPPDEILDMLPVRVDEVTGIAEIDLTSALDIEYTSPLARLSRSDEAVATIRTFEQLAPFAQINPEVYDVFDTDTLPRELATINGVPAKMLRPEKAVQAMRQQRQQEKAMAVSLEAAPVAASAAKDLAQAAATAGNLPQPIIQQ